MKDKCYYSKTCYYERNAIIERQIIMKIHLMMRILKKLRREFEKTFVEWFWQFLAQVRLADSCRISNAGQRFRYMDFWETV